MASNGITAADEDGDFEDWIELHNPGDNVVNLSGWGLSDDANHPFKWVFPDLKARPGEFLLVWASGKDRKVPSAPSLLESAAARGAAQSSIENRKYTHFAPRGENGFTADYNHEHLTNRAGWEIPPVSPGQRVRVFAKIKTDGANVALSLAKGASMGTFASSRVVISSSHLQTFDIELTNQSDSDLNHVVFVASPSSPGGSITVQDFDVLEVESRSHTNFRIRSAGETIVLSRPDGTRADEFPPTAIPRDLSVGRMEGEGDTWFFFAEPTPGHANTKNGYSGILDPPTFSDRGGFFKEGFELQITHPDPEAIIYYTIDGSEPDPANVDGTSYPYKNHFPETPDDPFGEFRHNTFQSRKYEAPIPVWDRSGEPDKLTQISSTFNSNPRYFPESPVRKGTVVSAIATKPGWLPSRIEAHTYFVWKDGSPYNLPILAITAQEDLLFHYEKGVYTAGADFDNWREANPAVLPVPRPRTGNFYRSGSLWEYPAHLEVFETHSPEATINQRVGFRIHGGGSRNNPLKSLRLYARSRYGQEDTMRHPFFDEKVPGSLAQTDDFFKRLLLRGSRGYINDLISHKIMQPVYAGVHRARPAIHFINGEYFGITSLRDRFDQHHLAHQFGLEPDDIMIIKGPRGRGDSRDIDAGGDKALEFFQQMHDFAVENNLSDPTNFDTFERMLDLVSYVDSYILNIFLSARDGFGSTHHALWRASQPSQSPFADGRWRTFSWDFDSVAAPLDENLLEFAAHPEGDRAFSIFRNLLENESFRIYFKNRFADHLNTTFKPDRIESIVRAEYEQILPYLNEHRHRWNSSPASLTGRDQYIAYAQNRPAIQRNHIREQFGISSDVDVVLNISGPRHGHIRINTIRITDETLGVKDSAYPWTGIYFQGVPIELEAMPGEGYRFVGWQATDGPAEVSDETLGYFSQDRLVQFSLSGNTFVTAVFEPIPLAGRPLAIHRWAFETPTEFLSASFSLVQAGALWVKPGPETTVGRETAAQGFPSSHLRVNHPMQAEMTFALPTTGYEPVDFSFITRRSGQGAGEQTLSYTIDGQTWTETATYPVFNDSPQKKSFDFEGLADVSDNANFAVRITFAEGDGGTTGNNRFDDIVLNGRALPGTNLPPLVKEEVLPERLTVVAGSPPSVSDLNKWFTDPEGEPITYTVTSSRPNVIAATLDGATLRLTGVATGEAVLTVSANDGLNPSTTVEVPLLAYPDPFVLYRNDFRFDFWASGNPVGTFPDHMIFLQSQVKDPLLSTELRFAYQIPSHDADRPEDTFFPYAARSRSRINGLGPDGISFINTGRERDVGGALLALNTKGASEIDIYFTAGTILPNSRTYAISLQFRLGMSGDWSDLSANGQPVRYVRHETAGHQKSFGPIRLPEILEDQSLVQLQWRYHHLEGDSGPRAQLRLNDIAVTSARLPESYLTWVDNHFNVTDANDPTVSGPSASPLGDNVPNLLKYALGLLPLERVTRHQFEQGVIDDNKLFIRFYRDPTLTDITYMVEASSDLIDWSERLFDSKAYLGENSDGEAHQIGIEIGKENRRFLRLRVAIP